jgi:hypothetical protein
MADDRKPDRITGHEIDFSWDEGPTKGETHRHRFEPDGSVRYWQLKDGAPKGEGTREPRYGAVQVSDDVIVVSYLGASGYTLTAVLNFRDDTVVGFASGAKDWFPVKGKFKVVR